MAYDRVFVGGTIRIINGAWHVLNDPGHMSEGLSHVEVLSNRLRVHYNFDADKVGVIATTMDETYSSVDIRCGSSVGLSYADVYFYTGASGSTPMNPMTLANWNGNVWINGWNWVEQT